MHVYLNILLRCADSKQLLLNCMMYLPVKSTLRKVSVHSRQLEQVCRRCPLWSDRFSINPGKKLIEKL